MKVSGNSAHSLAWNKAARKASAFIGPAFIAPGIAAMLGAVVFALYVAGLDAQSQAQKKTAPPVAGKKKTTGMIHPMRSPVYISGSFGEYRNYGRFHYGVDYKTFNRNGLPVLMPANGIVRRIQVSDKGYGNALFIASGASMLTFAHLQDFAGVNPELDYLRSALEFLRPKERVNIALPGWFRFRRGQVFARSGESGSGAPHLHFEVRRGGQYFNALSFPGLGIKDDTAPVLRHVYLEFGGRVLRLPVKQAGGGAHRTDPAAAGDRRTIIRTYAVGSASDSDPGDGAGLLDAKSNSIIVPTGAKVRMRIGTYDTMAAENRNGIQKLEMSVDGKSVFRRDLNRIRLGDLGRADKTYDTVRTIIGREYVYLLFNVGGGGRLSAPSGPGTGQKSAAAPERKVSIQVGDGVGNLAILDFKLVFRDAPRAAGSTAAGPRSRAKSNPEPDSLFTRVGPRGKQQVTAKSGPAELSLNFPAGSLHLPGLVRLKPLARAPREKIKTTGSSATPAEPAFRAVGPAFEMRARNLYYRRFARGRAKWPAKKEEKVALFGLHAASGRYRLVAMPYKRTDDFAYYRFTYRMTGPIAQLIDLTPPKVRNRFRWKSPEKDGKGGIFVREYILSDRGTGISKRRTRVLLDGNHLPFEFIRDRSTLRIEIPRSMLPGRGAMLSVRTGDFADNESDWYFDFLSPGSR